MLSNFSVAPERRKLCNTPENINGLDPPPPNFIGVYSYSLTTTLVPLDLTLTKSFIQQNTVSILTKTRLTKIVDTCCSSGVLAPSIIFECVSPRETRNLHKPTALS